MRTWTDDGWLGDRIRRSHAARFRALSALARLHPADYLRLYEEETARAELDQVPVLTKRPCACGGVIIRRKPQGRWPARCEQCRRMKKERAKQAGKS